MGYPINDISNCICAIDHLYFGPYFFNKRRYVNIEIEGFPIAEMVTVLVIDPIKFALSPK